MGNNLVPAGRTGAIAVYDGHDNPWADMGREVESGGSFLNFNGNSGELTFGSDDTVLPDGSTVVADMINMSAGWICWKNAVPVEEVLVPVTEGKPPREHELKDHGPYDDDDDGWREALAVPMLIESVEDNPNHELVGTKLLFKTSTGGAVRSAKKLSGAFGKLFREHPGELPIVEITTESYIPRDKKYGKKYAINFKVVDWIDETGLSELAGLLNDEGGEYLPENDNEPVNVVQPEPEPEPEVVAEPEPAPPPMRTRRGAGATAQATPAPAPAAAAQPAPEQAPTRRRGAAAAAPAAAEPAMEAAPEPRGRSEERGGRRTRRFAA